MKSYKSFISEEVLPTAMVQDGKFDLENDATRAEINSILAGICSKPHITPYITLHKVSKALAYFSIILPKRSFLEGSKGVEVYEMMQFGNKMGMNDQGEFINYVPEKYFLFFQFNQMMGMFGCTAKVVDKVELDRLLDVAEITMKECWDDKATQSQRSASREGVKTYGQEGTVSTKQAVDTMQRKKDKKLSDGDVKDFDKPYNPTVALDEEDLDEEIRVNKWSDGSHTARVSKDGKVLGVYTRKKHSDLNKEIKSRFGIKGNIPHGEEPGKAKTHQVDEGMTPVKKSYAMRKMKRKVSTTVKQGLGVEKGADKTVLVTNKGDPKAATGGGVHRISKDKYDPAKHNLASE